MALLKLKQQEVRECSEKIFRSAGVPEKDAKRVADNLLTADILGLPSHGVMRVKPYVQRIDKGLIKVRPELSYDQAAENMFKVDGDNALGQVATMYALELCMTQAKKSGNAIAVINHMNHFGMAGYYTRIAAKEGLLAFICTNASPTMAPFGGLDCILGTNPLCVSFGAGKYDNFTLDVATTAAARGKIRLYQREGKDLPIGWAVDAEGNDTTDPSKALKGALLPMGGHKGYGLSMAVDFLSGVVADADLSYEAQSMFEANDPANTGCYISVVDLSRFVSKEKMEERVESWFARIKSSRLRPGFHEIMIPGEIENRRSAASGDQVELSEQTFAELQELAKDRI